MKDSVRRYESRCGNSIRSSGAVGSVGFRPRSATDLVSHPAAVVVLTFAYRDLVKLDQACQSGTVPLCFLYRRTRRVVATASAARPELSIAERHCVAKALLEIELKLTSLAAQRGLSADWIKQVVPGLDHMLRVVAED
jgi:hypothetical protein